MTKTDEERIEQVTRTATMSLLLFGSLHALALAAFFWQALQPWNVRVGIAAVTCLLAYLAAWLVWRTAGVFALALGVLAVLGSLARVIVPLVAGGLAVTFDRWAVGAIALTLLCLVPIVRAIVVVARSPR